MLESPTSFLPSPVLPLCRSQKVSFYKVNNCVKSKSLSKVSAPPARPEEAGSRGNMSHFKWPRYGKFYLSVERKESSMFLLLR